MHNAKKKVNTYSEFRSHDFPVKITIRSFGLCAQ